MDNVIENSIKALLNLKLSQGLLSQGDYEKEYNNLLNNINDNLIKRKYVQNDISNSSLFNDAIADVFVNLYSSYNMISNIDKIVSRHIKLNEAMINDIDTKLEIAEKKADITYDSLISRKSSNVFINSFKDNNFNNNFNLYIDRDGSSIIKEQICHYDKYSETITLPYISKNNMLLHSNGNKLASIHIIKQLGGDTSLIKNNTTNDIAKCIDTSIDTYWCETILVSSPIAIDLGEEYYNIASGAVCEIEIVFNNVCNVNEIRFNPFITYPFEIIAIKYTDTDDDKSSFNELVSPNLDLKGGILTKTKSFKFNDVSCKRIRVLIRQINYTKENSIIDESNNLRNELWFGTTVNDKSYDENIYSPHYEDKRRYDSTFNALEQFIDGRDIYDIVSTKNERIVDKFKYTYGFTNLEVNYNDYHNVGMYVSNKIDANGNIKNISLESDNIIPDNCDIEYYLSFDEIKWLPIVPLNQAIIKSEKIFNNNYKTRFPYVNVVNICENNIILDESSYTVNNGVINITNYNKKSIYTISYKPLKECTIVNSIDDFVSSEGILETTENIPATNSQMYSISNSNFNLYKKPSITLSDNEGNIIVCKYIDNSKSPRLSYVDFNEEEICFYILDRKIYFNKPIDLKYNIKVSYQHFPNKVTLKAILRNNSISDSWVSPEVNKYKVNFITF